MIGYGVLCQKKTCGEWDVGVIFNPYKYKQNTCQGTRARAKHESLALDRRNEQTGSLML